MLDFTNFGTTFLSARRADQVPKISAFRFLKNMCFLLKILSSLLCESYFYLFLRRPTLKSTRYLFVKLLFLPLFSEFLRLPKRDATFPDSYPVKVRCPPPL